MLQEAAQKTRFTKKANEMKIIVFLSVITFFVTIKARLFEGQCRERPAPVVRPFIYKLYLGTWYEIEWYDDEYPTYDECIKFTYTKTSRNNFNMTLDLKQSNNNFASQQYQGHGIVSRPGVIPIIGLLFTPGMLSTTFDTGPPTRVNHEILATDYKSFSFVWDCLNVNATHYNEKMWYFDRNPNPSKRPVIVEELINLYFEEQYIRKTYQGDDCGWNVRTRSE